MSGRKLKLPKVGGAGASSTISFNSTTTTVEEALEAGIEHEERGERFSVGPKAERAFNEAAKAYAVAAQLDRNNAIPIYNLARVHFILATQFQLPPVSYGALQQCLQLYQKAGDLSSALPSHPSLAEQMPLGAELPDAFALDVKYNLHAAQQSFAELLEESQQPADEATIISLYSSAAQGFMSVGILQKSVLDDSAHRQAEAEREEAVVGEDAAEQDKSSEATSIQSGSDGYAETEEWTSSPVTPAATLETLLSAHTCVLSLLSRSFPAHSPPHGASPTMPTLETAADDARAAIARADQLVQSCANASELSDEGEWELALANLRTARRAAMVAEADRRSEVAALNGRAWPATAEDEAALSATESETSQAASGLLDLASASTSNALVVGRDPSITSPDELVRQACDLADQLLTFSVIRARRAPSAEHADARKAWDTACLATKLFQYAHGALVSRKAGALGAVDASTSAGRARANISCSLSSASLLRAGPAASPLVAAKSRETLVDNARVFARRALGELGLGSAILPEGSKGDDATSDASVRALQAYAPHGGWEGARTSADAVLAAVRAAWTRQQYAQATQNQLKHATSTVELSHLTRCTQALLKGTHGGSWATAMAFDATGPRRIVEEGWACGPGESDFWIEWQRGLL